MPRIHPDILHAALAGLEAQKQKLDQQIAEVRSLLEVTSTGNPGRGGIKRVARVVAPIVGRTKRTLSAEGRERISAAQRKRWSATKAANAGGIGADVKTVAKPVAPIVGQTKRVLSPEAKKRIAAAQKKRWANFRKSQKSA